MLFRTVSSESDTTSDSDSDSSEEADATTRGQNAAAFDLVDDDEDHMPVAASGAYFQTKHEVQEAEITVPEVDQLDAHEILEKVGEVMNIVDRLAIVRGLPCDVLNRGSDRALDSDTLLAFDDRKVFGYVRLCLLRISPFYFFIFLFLFAKTLSLTQNEGRFTKRSDQPHNRFIKSNSALHSLSTPSVCV